MQVRILTISPDVLDYAIEVQAKMKAAGIRAEVMSGTKSLGF